MLRRRSALVFGLLDRGQIDLVARIVVSGDGTVAGWKTKRSRTHEPTTMLATRPLKIVGDVQIGHRCFLGQNEIRNGYTPVSVPNASAHVEVFP